MNIQNVIDSAVEFANRHPQSTQEEIKRHICEKLLEEFKEATTDELLPHLRSVDMKKKRNVRLL